MLPATDRADPKRVSHSVAECVLCGALPAIVFGPGSDAKRVFMSFGRRARGVLTGVGCFPLIASAPTLRLGPAPRDDSVDLGGGSWFDRGVTTGSETVQNAPEGRALDPAEALRHERRVSAALREVGVALGTTFDLDDLLELILSKLTELVEADRATLYLLDEVKNDLVSRLVVGDSVRSIRMKVGHGIAGIVAQTGKSIRIRDA